MKILGDIETLQALAKALGKPCMFIALNSNGNDALLPSEYCKAAPYLEGNLQIHIDHQAYLVFDSDAEMEAAFKRTVGDDGPTSTNVYEGDANVYALTCGADGELRNENT